MEATPTTIKQDPPSAPPAVTVNVQLEDEPVAENRYERRRVRNQKRAFRRQRVAESRQEQQGDNYNYSNNDLRNVINIKRDARNVIISRKEEREEIEAYSSSSNYRIPESCPGSSKKRNNVNADFQGKSSNQHRVDAPIGGDKINKRSNSSTSCTQKVLTQSSSSTHSTKLSEHLC